MSKYFKEYDKRKKLFGIKIEGKIIRYGSIYYQPNKGCANLSLYPIMTVAAEVRQRLSISKRQFILGS